MPNRALLRIAYACALALLAGCSGRLFDYGGGVAPATTTTVQARVVAAPVTGARVHVFSIDVGSRRLTDLGSAATDATGHCTVAVPGAGPLLVLAAGGAYPDEATGAQVSLGTTLPATMDDPRQGTLEALIGAGVSGQVTVILSPLSTFASRYSVYASHATPTALSAFSVGYRGVLVGIRFGVSPLFGALADVSQVDPLDLTDPSARALVQANPTSTAALLGVVLAGLSRGAVNAGAPDPLSFVDALARDYQDGTFNGAAPGATTTTTFAIQLGAGYLASTAATTDLVQATTQFLNDATRNRSGTDAATYTALLNAIANSPVAFPGGNFDVGPTFAPIANQTVPMNAGARAVTITGVTAGTPFEDFTGEIVTFQFASGNPAVIPSSALSVTGTGALRTLTFSVQPGVTGTATVTASASDGTTTYSQAFAITVTPPAVPVGPLPPAAISVFSGGGQSGTAGGSLANPLVALVTDAGGNPVSLTAVTFTAVSGGGSVSVATTLTASDGKATTALTLGTLAGPNMVSATAAGGALAATFTETALAGAPARVLPFSGSGQSGPVGQPLASPLVAVVQDTYGNPVSGTSVSFARTAGNGSVAPATPRTGADGKASSALTLGTIAGQNAVSATILASSTPAVFTATGTASGPMLSIYSGDGQAGTPGARLVNPLTVFAGDAFGNALSGVTLSFAATAGGGSVSPSTAVTNALGIASAVFTLGPLVTTNTAQATAAGIPGAVTFTATDTSGPPAQAVFIVQPADTDAALPMSVSVTVEVRDAFGNPVLSEIDVVTLSIGSNPGGGMLSSQMPGGTGAFEVPSGTASPGVFAGTQGGRAVFLGASIDKPGGGYTLVASLASGVSVTSAAFNIRGTGTGTGLRLAFYNQPRDNVMNGISAWSYVSVAIEDGQGNVSTTATNAVTLSIGQNPGTTLQGSTVTQPAVNGIAGGPQNPFNQFYLQFSAPGNGVTLLATSPGLATATSAPFDLTSARMPFVFVTQPPTTVYAGDVVPPITVSLQDGGGNILPNANYPLRLQAFNGAFFVAGALQGTATKSLQNGTATFSDLRVVNQSIRQIEVEILSSPSYSVSSGSEYRAGYTQAFTVVSGTAASLSIDTQPSEVAVGLPILPAVSVSLHDGAGYVATSATGTVSVALGQNPPGATLGGTLTVTPVAGIATFSDLAINRTGTAFTLVVSTTALPSVTSVAFNVDPVLPKIVSVTVPAVIASTSCAPVDYLLQHATSEPIDIIVKFRDPAVSTQWTRATEAGSPPGADGMYARVGSPAGTAHRFYWNVDRDLPLGASPATMISLQPIARSGQGLAVTVPVNVAAVAALSEPALVLTGDMAADFVAAADWNGDGMTDLLLVNEGDTSAYWRGTPYIGPGFLSFFVNTTVPGASVPSFATKVDIAAGRPIRMVAVGDLNGDGRPDLVVTSAGLQNNTVDEQSTIAVLLNAVPAGWPASQPLDPSQLMQPVVQQGGGQWQIAPSAWLYTGVPYYPGSYLGYTGTGPAEVAIRDMNGDGLPDIVVSNYLVDTVAVLLNTTPPGSMTATFAPPVEFPLLGTGYPISFTTGLAVGDVNGDGRPDVMVLDEEPPGLVRVLLNQIPLGSTTLVTATAFVPKPGRALASPVRATTDYYPFFTTDLGPSSLALEDLNGDGRPDVVSINWFARIFTAHPPRPNASVLVNGIVPGTMQLTDSAQPPPPSFAPFFDTQNVALPWQINDDIALTVRDLNLDGRPDIVAPIWQGGASILINTTPAGATATTFSVGQDLPSVYADKAAVADFNGDGKPDVAMASWYTVRVHTNQTAPRCDPIPKGQLTLAIGTNPAAVAAGDLNGDGKADIAIANTGSNTVSIFLGLGNGTFAPRVDVPSDAPSGVAIGDVNGDGLPDLVVANGGPSRQRDAVSIYLNTAGAGASAPSFTAAIPITVGAAPASVAIADVDNDGNPDIITANSGAGTFTILTSIVFPQGTASRNDFSASSPNPGAVAVADLNNDGRPDVVLADSAARTVNVFFNQGGTPTTFNRAASLSTSSSGIGPYSVAIADLDGDGEPDIVAPNYSAGTIAVFVNETVTGSATASFASVFTAGGPQGPRAIALADLDGSGTPDIVLAGDANAVSFLRVANNGGTLSLGPRLDVPCAAGPVALALADLNGDGLPDVLVASPQGNGAGVATVILNTSTQPGSPFAFRSAASFPTTQTHPVKVVMADLDGDGVRDLVVADYDAGKITVYPGTTRPGSLQPSFGAGIDFPVGTNPTGIGVGDVNADGRPDLVVASSGSNTLSVLVNTTSGTPPALSFAPKVDFAPGTSCSVAIGDVNGDGRPDLVVADLLTNRVAVLLNKVTPGSTTLTASSFDPAFEYATAAGPWEVALADLDGDGRLDIAASAQTAGMVSVLRNEVAIGAQSLSASSFAQSLNLFVGSQPGSISVGDLNGDGRPDIAVACAGSNAVAILLNSTQGSPPVLGFSLAGSVSVGQNPLCVAMADLDNDGRADLAVANYSSDTISILFNRTTGSPPALAFAPRLDFLAGTSPAAIVAGDLNGDGRADLAVANRDSNGVSIFMGQ